jgi:uncharacterized membrane protein
MLARLPYALIEVVMLVLFVMFIRFAYRTGGRRRLLELLSGVPFGLLLEQGDITIFGSYAYSQLFFLKLGAVPVSIALAWAMIINSSMFISDTFRIPARLAPLSDAVFTIILDLSFDAIAIRQGLWHWNIRLDQGFYGVPAGNYYSWLFVALGFSAFTRLVRRWGAGQPARDWFQLLVPIPAYLTLLVSLLPFIALQGLFFHGPGGGFPTFVGTLAAFAFITARAIPRRRPRLPRPWSMPLLPRLAMHAYFIGIGILVGIFWQAPVLLLMSLSMLLIELWLTAGRPQEEADRQRSAA